jgi:hypothetical protein
MTDEDIDQGLLRRNEDAIDMDKNLYRVLRNIEVQL